MTETNIHNIHKILYSRPGMYIAPYDRKYDAGSFVSNFLDAIYSSQELSPPDAIYASAVGANYVLEAQNCYLQQNLPEFHTFLPRLNVTSFRQSVWDYGNVVAFTKSIVWFTDYCLVQVSDQTQTFCHAFWRGTPLVGQPEEYQTNRHRNFSFCFTLPAELFGKGLLEVDRLTLVLDEWEERMSRKKTDELTTWTKFERQWTQQSQHYFSLCLRNRR